MQMAIFSSVGDYSSPHDLSFRVNPKSEIDAVFLSDFIEQKGYDKIGIMYLENDFGVGYRDVLDTELSRRGIEIVGTEGYVLVTSDFRSSLSKLKAAQADAIFMVGLASHYGTILVQAQELDIDAQFMGMWSAEDPVLFEIAGEAAEGLIYTYPFDATADDESIERFVSRFRQRHGRDPDAYAAQGYESLLLAVQALSVCENNTDCVIDYLTNLNNYNSVFGTLSFDQNGDVDYDFFVKTVRNGKFVPL